MALSSPPAVFKHWPVLPLSWNSAICDWDLCFRWYLFMAADSFETWIIQGRINLHRSWKEAGCRGVGWSGVEGHPHSALTITFPGCLSPYSPAVTLFFFLPWIWATLVLPFSLKYMSCSDYSIYILGNQSHSHQALGITGFFTGVWKVPGSKLLFRRQKQLVRC